MKLRVVAVSARQPEWVDAGFAEYARRLPPEMPLELRLVKPEPRQQGKPRPALLEAEAARIRDALTPAMRPVVLDERGAAPTTPELAERIRHWMRQGEDVAFLIGGPDGLAPSIKATAAETLRLSSLTLPHGLARVVLAEALYRAVSVLRNHPYHRA